MRAEKPREIAARVLLHQAQGSGWAEHLLETELARAGTALAPLDRRLVQELVFGVIRWQATLDWLIRRKTDGRLQKIPLQVLLRLGLYQMFWLDRIPDHAAVHESVELAKNLGFGSQSGFVNALLRGCLRERSALEQELLELRRRLPATGWSHPDWLYERWRARWGDESTAALLEWDNRPATTFARVNRLKATPEELAAAFEHEAVLFTPRPYDWAGTDPVFELREHPPFATLESFRQGYFYLQDPSTLLAPALLDPQPGETILDLCAAPGGKTTYIAQLMQNRGRILAHDSEPARLNLIEQNLRRLGATCIEITPPAGAEALARLGPVDRALVDAPCSNTGVMRRRVDLRWRVGPEEIHRLQGLQGRLLEQAAQLLKPGGVLVYSTCSLEQEENTGVVQNFLGQNPAFTLEQERQLTPFADHVDGAYVARMRKQ